MKRKPFLFILIVVAMILLLFVSCGKKQGNIPVPENLSVDNNVLTWDAIVGAVSYDIKIDDNVYTSEENKFSLPIADSEEHEISVRVTTYDGTSAYSESIVYKRRTTKTTLPQLSAPRISMTGNRVMWSTVLNNDGYKIYFDGKSYLAPKNSTYYDLTFTKDGRFEITMQTLGDGVSYATSTISSSYMVTVKDGKAPLQSLAKVDFTFNATERVIEWRNRYSADAVSYEIYQDNSPIPLITIPADATKTRMTYEPLLLGGKVSFTMRLISNNGLYNASAFNDAITFPIADAAPANLSVLPEEEQNGYYIEWGARAYSDGYVVEIDGTEYPVTQEVSMAVPAALTAGRHVVRVRTSGNGIYYTDSLYSGGIVFYTKDQGKMTTALDTPTTPVATITDESITLRFDAVQNASSYNLCFVSRGGASYLTAETTPVVLTSTAVGTRAATTAERNVIARIRSELETGVTVSVSAVPESDLYVASPFSAEAMLTTSNELEPIAYPTGFAYDARGFVWAAAENASVTYELLYDGEIRTVRAGEGISVSEGEHTARIRQHGENALWSQEIFFRAPVDLAAPSSLAETSSVLTFTGSENASAYILYVNGEALATIYPSESLILLSSYIKTDGNYVLALQAVSSSTMLRPSPLSEECLYVKSDGAYGTESKPYVPRSASELLSLMRENPGAYFELIAGGVYNYTDYNFAAVSAFDFNGVLIGNGATLKGIKLTSPLFSALNGATLRNLNVEIDATNFGSSQGGVLAQNSRRAVLSDLNIKVTGSVAFVRSANFGVLFYGADELTIRNVSLNYDISLTCGENCAFGAVAYDLKGSVTSLSMAGNASVRGKDTRFSGLSVTGNATVNGFTQALETSVKGTSSAVAAGCAVDGTVTASSLQGGMILSLDSPIATYYGVSRANVSLSNSTLGGSVQTTAGREIFLYGVGLENVLLLKNVTVASSLSASAEESLTAFGFAETIGNADTSGSAFTGTITLTAEEETAVAAASFAETLQGAHSLRSAGVISVTGGKADIASGALSVETLTLQNQSRVLVTDVPRAEISGVAKTGGNVTVTGSFEVQAANCGETHFSGVCENGDPVLTVQDYRVFGNVASALARVAGVSENVTSASFLTLSLTVDLDVASPDIVSAGALLGATSLTLPQTAALSTTIDGTGSGKIAGFGLGLQDVSLSNFSLTGALSLTGAGSLFGVAQEVRNASGVTSGVSLSAEGGVTVFGLFERVAAAENLALAGSDVVIRSNAGEFYGLAEMVSSGRIDGGTLSNVTLRADPESTETQSLARIFGMSDRLIDLASATVSGVTYTVGAYDSLLFGGLADSFSGTVQGGSVVYTLNSSAKDAIIGGAFAEGSGRINSLQLGGTNPLTVVSSGRTDFGGLLADSGNVSVSRGSSSLNVTLAPSQEGVSRVGGAAATISSNHAVTFADHVVSATILRTGAGTARLGGAVAELLGGVSGASTEANITSAVSTDVIGGVAAVASTATVQNCLAKGRIESSASIGGLIGDCSGGTVNGATTAVTVVSAGNAAGGVFSTVKNASILNVSSISRLTQNGFGFFKSGENLSMDFCYFAGEAHEYLLADSVTNCATSAIFADASLNDLPVAREGTISCEYRSFGYGYDALELGSAFVADGQRYPYVAAMGYPFRNATVTLRALSAVNIAGTVDLFANLGLPRLYDAATPSITWVDGGSNLEIVNGVATVVDNGSGVLYGVLAGGVRVYSVEYVSSGFIPLAGEGTELSPYLVEDIKYFHHVRNYADNDPTAYFKLVIEGGTLENVEFETLFTMAHPFRGTFDFNNVTISSSTIAQNGIFGCLNGATVKNLVLTDCSVSGAVLASSATGATIQNVTVSGGASGEGCLIDSLTDCAVNGVTVKLESSVASSFVLFKTVTNGTLQNLSARFDASTGDTVEFHLIGISSGTNVQKAQALFFAQTAGKATASLVKQDQSSTFGSVMFIADVLYCDRSESEVAGFAFSADGTSFDNSAVILAGVATVYPLVKQGTATYSSVNVLASSVPTETGVTALTVENAGATLASMTGYVSGAIYTPLGFALLSTAATPDYTFTLDLSEIELTEEILLASAFNAEATSPLATLLRYTFTGSCAVIRNGALRPVVNGEGVLTVTNLYGESRTVAVTVVYDGFASGDGTELDPYLIESFDDFKRLSAYANGSFFSLTTDISGEISESLVFNGILKSTGHTIAVTLVADALFEEGVGVIDGVNFVVSKDALTATDGGVFMTTASGLTFKNGSIRVECPTVELTGDSTFGLLFGEMDGCTLDTVAVTFADADITAEGGKIGLVAGALENTLVNGLTVTGNASLTASGKAFFGAFGRINAPTTYYRKQIGADPENYVDLPYVDGMTLALMLAVAGDVTVGGAAGESTVQMKAVTGTVDIEVTSGSAVVGGAVGVLLGGSISASSLTGQIDATVTDGAFGGLVGNCDDGAVTGSTVAVPVFVTAQGKVVAGGVIGSGSGTLTNVVVTANVEAHSAADSELVALLDVEEDSTYLPIVAAGGAIGYFTGRASGVKVTVAYVHAGTDYTGDAFYALAGGLAGSLRNAENIEVLGIGSVEASGSLSVAAGVVAVLGEDLSFAVVSGVTVSAGVAGYAAGVASLRDEGNLNNVFATIGSASGALVSVMQNDATMDNCAYLYGSATLSSVTPEQVTGTQNLASLEAFYNVALYDDFDGEIWSIDGASLPSLR